MRHIAAILALDFGTRTGWAALSDGHVESGVQTFDLARGESAGMRFIRFRRWLEEILALTRPGLCVYEQAHHRGGHATELLVGMATRLQEACAEKGMEYTAVHSATLKKASCGSGRADKSAMIAEARRRFPGREIADDNEADALMLLEYARAKFGEAAEVEARGGLTQADIARSQSSYLRRAAESLRIGEKQA
jgi:Holliday junction resolvasome RuvABC endonuclease subunit